MDDVPRRPLQEQCSTNNVNRDVNGRDTFYLYLKDAVSTQQALRPTGPRIDFGLRRQLRSGQVNWPVGNTIAMGPVQDTYDGHAVNLASMFLGINVADCLLCHDGARHLDQVNLWGAKLNERICGVFPHISRVSACSGKL